MGTRRDDISAAERMQIGVAMLAPNRRRAEVKRLRETYHVSRQTLYDIADQTQAILLRELAPGRHGPHPTETVIRVDRQRVVRATLALTAVGVSQRDVQSCLAELLDTSVSLGWVNGQLAALEAQAAQVNAQWQPSVGEGLAGDELFAYGQPHRLVVDFLREDGRSLSGR